MSQGVGGAHYIAMRSERGVLGMLLRGREDLGMWDGRRAPRTERPGEQRHTGTRCDVSIQDPVAEQGVGQEEKAWADDG